MFNVFVPPSGIPNLKPGKMPHAVFIIDRVTDFSTPNTEGFLYVFICHKTYLNGGFTWNG